MNPRRDRPQSSRFTPRWFLWRGLGVLAAGMLAGAGARVVMENPWGGPIGSSPNGELSEICRESGLFCANDSTKPLEKPLSVLVLGVDRPDPQRSTSRPQQMWSGRSDTILLVRVDPVAEAINVLSVPRDTRVRLPERGIGKINSANARGGPLLTGEILSTLLSDAPVDRYVLLNTEGIVALVDALGGIDIYVEKDMQYDDNTQDLHIDLKQGQQRLNGDQAHQYLRFRQDELGDIGRVQRQQKLMRVISRQLLKPRTLLRFPKIKQAIEENVETSLTWEELFAILRFAFDSQESGGEDDRVTPVSNPSDATLQNESANDRLNLVLLPGRFSESGEFGDRSFWVIDPVATYKVATSLFGGIPDFGTPTARSLEKQRISIENATGLPQMGGRMADSLEKRGFSNIAINADAPRAIPITQILAQRGDTAMAREIQALLGFGEVRVQSTGDISAEVTVRVGRDWAEYWYPEVVERQQRELRSRQNSALPQVVRRDRLD
ncbi:MAG: LCP family protein [Cyanobacteria bacterium J06639_1]